MYGEWLRVTPAELERAKYDIDWAEGYAEAVNEAEYALDDVPPVADRRSFGTDKTWHALDYLLSRQQFPVSIIYGEESFVDDPDESEIDWGYGPPSYLTPDQVGRAAAALADLTEEELLAGVTQEEFQREEIYPPIWDRPGELPWAVCHLPDVKAFFAAAARAGDAMICWIG